MRQLEHFSKEASSGAMLEAMRRDGAIIIDSVLEEDTLTALFEFRSGVFGCYDTSWSVPGYQTEGTTVLVEGDEGTMEITDDWLRAHHLTGKGALAKGWSRTHRSEFDRADLNLAVGVEKKPV